MDAATIGPISQVTVGAIVVWIIERLKKWAALPWITQYTDRLNRALAVVGAILTATGITWSFAPATGTLTVTGLTLDNVIQVVWLALQQIVLQHALYHGVFKAKP